MPIKGAKKTFEQLLEEQLATEQSPTNEPNSAGRAKRQPVKFLKRGEGLSRFNLKENISPQKDYKPGSKTRQPLVDYSKPLLKPRQKEVSDAKKKNPSTSHKSVNKTETLPVARKVASVTSTASPRKTNPLRRSNTLPPRKHEPIHSTNQQQLKSTSGSSSKRPLTSSHSSQQIKPKISSSVHPSATTKSITHSPTKNSTVRPQSAMERSTPSYIAKPTSPRKTSSLSPVKQGVSTSDSSRTTSVITTSSVAAAALTAATPKGAVDSSFYSNIRKRVEGEAVESEELQVSSQMPSRNYMKASLMESTWNTCWP